MYYNNLFVLFLIMNKFKLLYNCLPLAISRKFSVSPKDSLQPLNTYTSSLQLIQYHSNFHLYKFNYCSYCIQLELYMIFPLELYYLSQHNAFQYIHMPHESEFNFSFNETIFNLFYVLVSACPLILWRAIASIFWQC